MTEKEIIDNLNFLRMAIYPYNYIVEQSELGLPWVRIRGYSCIGFMGEKQPCLDLDSEELKIHFEKNQNASSPENVFLEMDKHIKSAGPTYYLISD